jgi:predicted transcriptional regulator
MRKISIKKEILKNLYLDKKLSSTEIGRLFKLTKQAIFYYLKKYNISRRTGNEVKKGELHPNFGKRGIFASGYKNGIYCKENYCDDCGIIIRNKYAKRCKPCSLK